MALSQTREDSTPKPTDQARRALIKRCNKNTEDNTEGAAKIHSGDRSICLQDHFKPYTPQTRAFCYSGQHFMPNSMWPTSQAHERRFSDQMRLELSHQGKHHVWQTLLITLRTPSPPVQHGGGSIFPGRDQKPD